MLFPERFSRIPGGPKPLICYPEASRVIIPSKAVRPRMHLFCLRIECVVSDEQLFDNAPFLEVCRELRKFGMQLRDNIRRDPARGRRVANLRFLRERGELRIVALFLIELRDRLYFFVPLL